MQPEPEPAIECADEPEPVPEEPPAPEPEPTSAVHSDPELPYKERSVWTRHLRDAFMGGSFIPGPQTKDLNLAFTPPHNTGSWEDFTPVFVEQARLYVLADKYGIEPLCQLVLSKLHQTLKDFKLYPTGVAGVLEFVRFVYSNTPPNYANRVDAMRSLATRYVVSVLGQIGETEEFQELLEEGGAFVTDFWHIIWSANATLRQ
ncbi:uncharacterized protein ACLA_023040 [Aspergillus clavatus NRRL 1]|uniref:Uncharacterized protein n=1 Tax=Aspergillus clavatus (strain ATCC 1007 / CBS 513.65 / DSM 816 / NCTC 3887 / NRRL 1 / QM 1276 / 107) TaxID=344612 RepID=A1CPL9_ASPCL|nr:uncharacterized protein ACLA_023040 [Aspergillus clavatus NRRL 1]EAW07590.1 hypothetical protein ACLA_023040 [Aspergillus clavatus NRRL 1]